MPSLPATYALADYTILFFKQYKQLALYDKAEGKVTHAHNLTNGRKLSISNGELTISATPEGTLYKTTYSMDSDAYVLLENNAIIIGTGDPCGGIAQLTKYPLDDSTNCPNVVLKWEAANRLSVSTACNSGCSDGSTSCKIVTDQSDITKYNS